MAVEATPKLSFAEGDIVVCSSHGLGALYRITQVTGGVAEALLVFATDPDHALRTHKTLLLRKCRKLSAEDLQLAHRTLEGLVGWEMHRDDKYGKDRSRPRK